MPLVLLHLLPRCLERGGGLLLVQWHLSGGIWAEARRWPEVAKAIVLVALGGGVSGHRRALVIRRTRLLGRRLAMGSRSDDPRCPANCDLLLPRTQLRIPHLILSHCRWLEVEHLGWKALAAGGLQQAVQCPCLELQGLVVAKPVDARLAPSFRPADARRATPDKRRGRLAISAVENLAAEAGEQGVHAPWTPGGGRGGRVDDPSLGAPCRYTLNEQNGPCRRRCQVCARRWRAKIGRERIHKVGDC